MKPMFKLVQLQKMWTGIRSSFWFLPAILIAGAILLALGLLQIDRQHGEQLHQRWPWILSTQADGAQSMLSAIAGSMITVAGVVFSITIVALAMAASQYSPRVLRNFMRDRSTQVVLGLFVGVFLYCLVVLRVTSGGEQPFLPPLAILGALLFTLLACAYLVYFIHHIATSIQASTMIDDITRETCIVIRTVFPDKLNGGDELPPCEAPPLPEGRHWHDVPSYSMGYIQTVDIDSLKHFVCTHSSFAKMHHGVGDFVAPDAALVTLALAQPPSEKDIDLINDMFAIASHRTIEQDPAFGVRQLVDIALKALSPGINDTTTAVTAVEHLGVLLANCVGRHKRAPGNDEIGWPLVQWRGATFESLVALAFNQIIDSARTNMAVMLSMIEAIEHIARLTDNSPRQVILRRWLAMIDSAAQACTSTSYSSQLAAKANHAALEAFQKKPPDMS
jgi:uncharacterized membrane protein